MIAILVLAFAAATLADNENQAQYGLNSFNNYNPGSFGQFHQHHPHPQQHNPVPFDQFSQYNPNNYFRTWEQSSNANPSGYQYRYITENEIKAQETGVVDENDPYEDDNGFGTHATGSYEYRDPEGNLRQVEYTADENGFRPVTRINGELQDGGLFPGRVYQAPSPQRHANLGGFRSGPSQQGFPGSSPAPHGYNVKK